MTRAQIAMEYLLVMGFATVLLVGYLVVVSDVQFRTASAATQAEVENIAGILQGEIVLAAQVRDGYNRSFYIPEDVRGASYIIGNGSRTIVVRQGSHSAARITPPYTGTPVPGTNYITKVGGQISFS